MSLLDPFMEQVSKLWARVDLTPVVRLGTVTAVSPLRVILDGDTAPLPFAPLSFVRGLAVGSRFACIEQHRRVIILATRGDDTGWVALPYASGFTAGTPGQLSYRVRGGVVYLRGGATGTFPSGAYTRVVPAAAIPVAYRPPFHYRSGAFGQAGSAAGAGVEINADGGVAFSHTMPTNPAWIACLASYPIE